MTNHGKIFEDRLEKALLELNIPYVREGSKKHYGTRGSSKGKFDFKVNTNIAIECKSIDRASNLRIPWPNTKSTAIKSHQLKALRKELDKGNTAGLLIEIRKLNLTYWLDIKKLDEIVCCYGMIAALHVEALEQYAIRITSLEIFLQEELKL